MLSLGITARKSPPMNAVIRSSAAMVLLALFAGPAALATEAPARAPAVQTVLECRKIEDGAQRLACYDKAVGAMAKADETGDLVTVDRQQRTTLRRQAFGFNLPSLSMFDKGQKLEENDRLTAKAAKVSRNRDGQWVITLEDGAIWVQTDDASLYPAPHAGSAIAIRRGTLGSFFMTIDGQQVRAKREG